VCSIKGTLLFAKFNFPRAIREFPKGPSARESPSLFADSFVRVFARPSASKCANDAFPVQTVVISFSISWLFWASYAPRITCLRARKRLRDRRGSGCAECTSEYYINRRVRRKSEGRETDSFRSGNGALSFAAARYTSESTRSGRRRALIFGGIWEYGIADRDRPPSLTFRCSGKWPKMLNRAGHAADPRVRARTCYLSLMRSHRLRPKSEPGTSASCSARVRISPWAESKADAGTAIAI